MRVTAATVDGERLAPTLPDLSCLERDHLCDPSDVTRSQPHAAVSPAAVDLVVLADYLIADPRMVRDLHSQGVAHLAVRVRDGTGLVGPLVIPGMTSCLGNH